MGRRESSRRALTHLLRVFHQAIKESLVERRPRQQLAMMVEIVTDGREDALLHVIHADGREVELRSGHRQKDVDEVINEERGND